MFSVAVLLVATVAAFAGASVQVDVVKQASEHYALYYNSVFPLESVGVMAIPSDQDFDDYAVMYNKKYASDVEKQVRRNNFKVNALLAQALQIHEQGTAKYGTTKFSDLSTPEFRSQYLGYRKRTSPSTTPVYAKTPNVVAPKSVDWRQKGAVTAVKNQGQCGSCWAFSTTGNIEGQWAIKKGKLISLSESELVDCDKVDQGCEGGLMDDAFKQVIKLGGLVTEKDYPYVARDAKCTLNKNKEVVYINSSVLVSHDEGEMATWVAANGPLSIAVNANNMQFYQGGIAHPSKNSCNPTELDHGVLIVGYGEEKNTPFWIVKNSWAADWGEEGYYRVYRGGGVCGVNQDPGSSVISS